MHNVETGTWSLGVAVTRQRPRMATQHKQLHWLQICQTDTLLFSEASPGLQVKKGLSQLLYVFLTTSACFWLLGITLIEGNPWRILKQCGLPYSPNQWLWEGNLSSCLRLSGRCLANLLLKTSNKNLQSSLTNQAWRSPYLCEKKACLSINLPGTNKPRLLITTVQRTFCLFVLIQFCFGLPLLHTCRLPWDVITYMHTDMHHRVEEQLSQK